jgi:hypothetical protein
MRLGHVIGMSMTETDAEVPLSGGRETTVWRRGDLVLREGKPWSATVLAFLRHLEAEGFDAAPRVIGTGFDAQGRETLGFIEGELLHPAPWREEDFPVIGSMLRRLHTAGRAFRVPDDAVWPPSFLRGLGTSHAVFGHCDPTPGNILVREGRPVGLIDWDNAGPVDPLIELAHCCWTNAQLYDDDVAERQGLASAETRARHVKLICEGYGLASAPRRALVRAMIDVAIADAADEAIAGGITPETTDPAKLWGIACRARSAAWMVRQRSMLEQALA